LHDMLGMDSAFKPKFLRHYAQGEAVISQALQQYHADVHSGAFPATAEVYA